ncbi:hypothetical protein BC332_25147 [Capsicum chinense]|nr:hypothetical protein BC332_25147 [Capsicum chinense]
MASMIEQCQVAPLPGSVAELTLPLTYFDHICYQLGFIRAWALLQKFGGHEQFLSKELILIYDRSIIKDPYRQAMSIWEVKKKNNLEMRDIVTLRERKVQGDCRAGLNPPLPQSYFGNYIVGYIVRTRHSNLAGKEGFTIAAELIGEVIQKMMKDEEWIQNGSWFKELNTIGENRMVTVVGSRKLDLCAAYFGWRRAAKLEFDS